MFYILFSAILLLLSNQPVLAEDDATVETFQGVVNSTDGTPRYIVVNERKILLGDHVEIKDFKEREADISDLKNGKWVYIAAEKRSSGLTAMRIYLLPKRIKDKEKSFYSFMKKEEEPKE